MDGKAWHAAVRGMARVRHDLATEQQLMSLSFVVVQLLDHV